MQIKIAERDNREIQFMLDDDGGFWFRVLDNSSRNVVRGIALSSDYEFSINRDAGGDVDAFFASVLPRCNEVLAALFSKDDGGNDEPAPPESNMFERLVWNCNRVRYDAASNELKL